MAIIFDFHPITIAAFHQAAKDMGEPTLDIVRHITLNTIRSYTAKHKAKYGETILSFDPNTTKSWRTEVFPYYKALRKTNRDKSDIDWKTLFVHLDMIKQELIEVFPGRVIMVERAESDDIIGVLTGHVSKYEPVIIVSPDNDMQQLRKYHGVKQWSNILKKELDQDPRKALIEKLIYGDKGDGIPNIRSADDSIVNRVRQKPIATELVYGAYDAPDLEQYVFETWGEEAVRNLHRNRTLIDFDCIPQQIQDDIIAKYESTPPANTFKRNKFMTYLVQNRMAMLVESLGDF